MTLCGEWSLVKDYGRYIKAGTLKCRRWTCEECGPKRKKQVVGQALAGRPDRMLTLTVNPAWGASPEERRAELARAWRLLCKRAMRKYGYRSIPCFVVVEKTQQGEPHLHILLRKTWLDQGWISGVMAELMSAPICWIERVKSKGRGASYVTKYLGKDPQPFGQSKRYWRSRDWCIETKREFMWDWKEKCTVKIVKCSLVSAVALVPPHFFTVQWVSPEEWIAVACPATARKRDRF